MIILKLNRIKENDTALVGGKAAACAMIKKKGYPVPDGYAVTAEAFRLFLAETGLEKNYISLLDLFNTCSDEEELESRCRSFQKNITETAIPQSIVEEILKAHTGIKNDCSVRSSGTIEDSREYAFAGIFHSELNVSPRDLMSAIALCWSRFFSFAVITHVLRNNIDPAAMGVALLVQDMVPADRAGVLFTMDPTGRDPGSAVLSVTEGTGEKLMDGQTGSDSFYIIRKTGRPKENKNIPGLNRGTVRKIFRTSMELERIFGHPQDTEWALANGKLYLLQSRPITTIDSEDTRDIEWTRELTEERYPQPTSPLGWTQIKEILPGNVRVLKERFGFEVQDPDHVARMIRNYVYSNRNFFKFPDAIRPQPLHQKKMIASILRELFILPFTAVKYFIKKPALSFKTITISRIFKSVIFPHAGEILQQWDKNLPGILASIKALDNIDVTLLSFDELFEHRSAVHRAGVTYMKPDLAIYIVKIACQWIIERMGKELRGKQHLSFLTDLTSGLDNNRTLEMNMEMEKMSGFLHSHNDIKEMIISEDYARALNEIEKRDKSLLDDFINRNGHLTNNWDVMEKTWGQDPHKILQMLRSFVISSNHRSFRDFHKEQQDRYNEARTAVLRELSSWKWMSDFLSDVIHYIREFMRIDEEHHFYCGTIFDPLRKLLVQMGVHLAEKNMINEPEDIFFLTMDELFEIHESNSSFTRKYLVQIRKNNYHQSFHIRPPDNFIGSFPVAQPVSDSDITEGVLRGEGGSPGVGIGTVRIIESPEDAREFKEGEVLVSTSPDPVFTPLFAVAAAMVTTTGSILSHGLVSAREYRLPAVTGISHITEKLKNGQKVKVDGDNGTVSLA